VELCKKVLQSSTMTPYDFPSSAAGEAAPDAVAAAAPAGELDTPAAPAADAPMNCGACLCATLQQHLLEA